MPDRRHSDITTATPGTGPANDAPPERWLVLMGLRASGKSTLGRLLAGKRGVGFVDLDEEVRHMFDGRTISDIWASDGEAAFRAAEARCLDAVLEGPPGVLALGGGTPTVPAAAATLRSAVAEGRIDLVYLRTSVERLARRLDRDRGDRPALAGAGGPAATACAEVAWAFEQRDAGYALLATFVVEVDAALGGQRTPDPPDAIERIGRIITMQAGEAGEAGEKGSGGEGGESPGSTAGGGSARRAREAPP